MANTLVSVYDRLSDAEQARITLLNSGFASSHVHLSAQEDEAGPQKSNFTVGNADADGKVSRLHDNDLQDDTYAHNYADPKRPGEILLTVDADDEQQRRLASDILHQCGAARVADHPGTAEF